MIAKKNIIFKILILIFCCLAAPNVYALSDNDKKIINQISKKFSETKTMTGKFVQFNADGSKNKGIFYLKRPGLSLFSYEDVPFKMLSDGNIVYTHNEQLDSWTQHDLSKTPLALITKNNVDFLNSGVEKLVYEGDYIILLSTLQSFLGDSSIQLAFNKNSLQLTQWTLVDPNSNTTIMVLYDVKKNINIPQAIFTFTPK
ncbi:outer membrane lipoprotein carrier protein LolA [Bartonella sp. DGB1]|uniref:LolA family protein n=1 Tax=Bartonella sp. DGB1 TaxID=3239807 RepID=UPI0035251E89